MWWLYQRGRENLRRRSQHEAHQKNNNTSVPLCQHSCFSHAPTYRKRIITFPPPPSLSLSLRDTESLIYILTNYILQDSIDQQESSSETPRWSLWILESYNYNSSSSIFMCWQLTTVSLIGSFWRGSLEVLHAKV